MIRRNRALSLVAIAVMALAPLLLPQAAAAATAPPPGTCQPIVPFRASNFGASIKIDNRFLPLVPGTQLTLQGRANTGGARLPHSVVFTVTDLVKRIDGVYSLIVHDVDIDNGVLGEAELSFWAQDRDRNVWNLGEYPEQYDNGKFTGAPSTWFTGLEGAIGGIHMLGDPRVGTPRYLQGYSPSIDFLDCAQVFARNQSICVPVQCYSGVLVTDETSPLSDPDAHQRKYHAPGVGIVQIGAVNDPEGETLELTAFKHLDPAEMARARQEVLRLERHAYQTNALYRRTPPAFKCVELGAVTDFVPGTTAGLACP